MAENERKNEIIGANYAWNSRSPVNLCKPWLNLGATSGSLYTYFDKGCFGNAECNAMLCLSDHQTMAFKDQSTIPKATFLERGVFSYNLTVSGKVKIFMPPTQSAMFSDSTWE